MVARAMQGASTSASTAQGCLFILPILIARGFACPTGHYADVTSWAASKLNSVVAIEHLDQCGNVNSIIGVRIYWTTKMEYAMEKHRIHFWDRCFFRRDLSFPEKGMRSSIRRLSVTVVIAANEPFWFRDDNNREESFQGIILGPTINDARIRAIDSHITAFDVFITTPSYRDLLHALDGESARPLTPAELSTIQPICRANFDKTLNQAEIAQLFDPIIYTLCERDSAPALDPRISKVCALVEKHPANEVTIKSLADKVHLSESRLRALFKKEMQCTLSLYIRNVAAWKTVPMLARGMNFTEAAQEAGFHDLSHYHRAVSEITGGPPSIIKDKKFSVSFGFDPN